MSSPSPAPPLEDTNGRCIGCTEVILNCTCYDAESESEHDYNTTEPGSSWNYYEPVEIVHNSDPNDDDTLSTSSYLSTVSNFSELEEEFGPLCDEEGASDKQRRESEPPDPDMQLSWFHGGNKTPPPSPDIQTIVWVFKVGCSSDSEKEPFVRTKKRTRGYNHQSLKKNEKMDHDHAGKRKRVRMD